MPTTNEALAAVMSERQFQIDHVDPQLESNIPLGSFTVAIRELGRDAVMEVGNPEKALIILRQLAATVVRALEVHGAPQKEGYGVSLRQEDNDEDDDEFDDEFDDEDEDDEDTTVDIVEQGQRAFKIEPDVWYRVNEPQRRTYGHLGHGNHIFPDVVAYCVTSKGGHRLLNKDGAFYYVQPGWQVLEVFPTDPTQV